MKKIILLILITVFSISCSENKIKQSTEDLENCAKWNWIALSDTKLWTTKAEAYFTYVPGEKIINKELTDEELLLEYNPGISEYQLFEIYPVSKYKR